MRLFSVSVLCILITAAPAARADDATALGAPILLTPAELARHTTGGDSGTLQGETLTALEASATGFTHQPTSGDTTLLDLQIHLACFDTGFGPATTTQPQPAPAPLDIVGHSFDGGDLQIDIDPGATSYGSVWLERLMTPGAGWLTDTGSVFNPGLNQLTTPLPADPHTRYRAIGVAP